MSSHYATIARYYDTLNADQVDDIPLYLELAEIATGPVLDVGCGSGRILFPFLAAGHEAHGIELESAMLALAENRAMSLSPAARARLSLFHGDATQYVFTTHYGLIFLSYNMLMHFYETAAQILLLQNLCRAAHSSTRLIIDLPHPGEVFVSQDLDSLQHERDIIDPNSGCLIQVFSRSRLDLSTQLLDVTWNYDEIADDGCLRRTVTNQRLRYFTKAELSLLLRISGWKERAVYGDYDRQPYEDGCERLLVIADLRQP